MDPKITWHKILEEIKPQVGLGNFKTWFSRTEVDQIDGQKIVLSVPSAFIGDSLKTRYLNLISDSLEKMVGQTLEIEFKVDPSKLINSKVASDERDNFFVLPEQTSSLLNPKFRLENFVVGLSNNVAFAAAQAVVQNPGLSYNPLLLYGGTGVGKTHLMLGVGNALLSKNPALKVIYCTSEQFMNDYVEALKSNRMGNLRTKYRSCDALLVDDIQFFSGREGTQEEFFHTFNALHGKNSQIILTSDRTPNEIAKLEDRLRSRFIGGLMVDIQSPDFDTRVAILKAKCEERGEIISDEALALIAQSLDTNIRELEGRLIQILQALGANNLQPTPENVSAFFQTTPKALKFDYKQIISSVCNYFDLTQKDLTGPRRQKGLVLPRHIVMYLLCEELGMTVERVGQLLGGRDHTTVMHGRDRIKGLISTNREVTKIMIEVKQKLI